MNIRSDYSYNYNVSMQGKPPKPIKPGDKPLDKFRKKIEQKIINLLPEKTFNDGKDKLDKCDKYGKIMSRPDSNRLIMGIPAIVIQPVIDYYNHRVDKETRVVSRNRILAKGVACTSVGVLVRGTVYQVLNKLTDVNGTKKSSTALLPKKYIDIFKNNPKKLTNYKSALSTIIALMVMTFTNFALDAPLTTYFTNRLNEKSAKKMKEKEVLYG